MLVYNITKIYVKVHASFSYLKEMNSCRNSTGNGMNFSIEISFMAYYMTLFVAWNQPGCKKSLCSNIRC